MYVTLSLSYYKSKSTVTLVVSKDLRMERYETTISHNPKYHEDNTNLV
jgi:hypothetical protein